MCTAQVLLLNRDVMRRNCGGGDQARGVRRRLFATNDSNPEGPLVILRRMQEEIRKKDAERWNFDFFTGKPLPGRYQWVPVVSEPEKKQTTTSPNSNQDERVKLPIVEEIRREAAPTESKKRKAAVVSSQPNITDYMTKKKRPSTEETSPSSLKARRVGRNNESLTTTTRLT